MRKICLFYILILVSLLPLQAQDFRCGTVVTKRQLQYEKDHASQRQGFPAPDLCLKKTLSVYMHFITDSLNACGISQTDVTDALTALNLDFAPMCLQFKICQQDTIYAYKYDKFDTLTELQEIKNLYVKPNVINVFVMTSINPGADAGLASFTEDWILLNKASFATPWKTWSHEMGHFFSLYHTFETSFGNELVNGSNCATTGDLLCDTEADITTPNFASGSCNYTDLSTDSQGNQYTPIIGNIMSYHPGTCKSPFTVQQLNKMAGYYISYRNYLY
ncbi:MAG: M43 family zinc metalloprotease [Bacteroidia bacterium]